MCGKYIRSAETREKNGKANRGKHRSEEQRKRIGDGHRGKHHSEGTKEKISRGNKGKCLSEETKKRIRTARAKQIFTKETRRKMSIAHTGSNNSRWKGGITRLPYSFNFNKELKAFIRKRDHHTCQLCGRMQRRFERNFPIHHINYDKMDCGQGNLITLCNRCNGKVNANREVWTKFFQQVLEIKTGVKSCVV